MFHIKKKQKQNKYNAGIFEWDEHRIHKKSSCTLSYWWYYIYIKKNIGSVMCVHTFGHEMAVCAQG